MDLNNIAPYFGHTATLLIILSATMRTIVKLRIVNLSGSLLFIIYGLIINALPILILNVVIACVHAYYLLNLNKKGIVLNLHKISGEQLASLDFYTYNYDDMKKFFDNVDVDECKNIFLVLKREKIAGILAGSIVNHTFDIKIDYVTREFRNFQIGKTLFITNKEILRSLGISRAISRSLNELHIKYLHRMGFKATDMENYYSLNL